MTDVSKNFGDAANDNQWHWGENGPLTNATTASGDHPSKEFWSSLELIYKSRFGGDRNLDPTKALSYFGYKLEIKYPNDYDSSGYGYTNIAKIETDFSGLGARPEWIFIDRSVLSKDILAVEKSLRNLIHQISTLNSDANGIMPDTEKKHLLVTLEAARHELTDSSYTNKSLLNGVVEWCGKILAKAGEAYLNNALREALHQVGEQLTSFIRHLPPGSFKLPF